MFRLISVKQTNKKTLVKLLVRAYLKKNAQPQQGTTKKTNRPVIASPGLMFFAVTFANN